VKYEKRTSRITNPDGSVVFTSTRPDPDAANDMSDGVKFTLENAGSANLVRGWEAGALRINHTLHAGTVVVSAESVAEVDLAAPDLLDEDALAPALAQQPEVLLIGTGVRQRMLAPALMGAVLKRGIGVEVMDTLAAARTYNVVVGDSRRVVAVLYPPDSA
jgi:uncharacterized protein